MNHDARKLVLKLYGVKGFYFICSYTWFFVLFSCVHILVRNAFILIESNHGVINVLSLAKYANNQKVKEGGTTV